MLDLAAALAQRGSVKDCEYFLAQASTIAKIVKSSAVSARVSGRTAGLRSRMRRHEEAIEKLSEAADNVPMVSPYPNASLLPMLIGSSLMASISSSSSG